MTHVRDVEYSTQILSRVFRLMKIDVSENIRAMRYCGRRNYGALALLKIHIYRRFPLC